MRERIDFDRLNDTDPTGIAHSQLYVLADIAESLRILADAVTKDEREKQERIKAYELTEKGKAAVKNDERRKVTTLIIKTPHLEAAEKERIKAAVKAFAKSENELGAKITVEELVDDTVVNTFQIPVGDSAIIKFKPTPKKRSPQKKKGH